MSRRYPLDYTAKFKCYKERWDVFGKICDRYNMDRSEMIRKWISDFIRHENNKYESYIGDKKPCEV